ncbi:MAG: hypothetical protein GVY17_07525 [Cyanobacteria bacterium]|jgi:hypothetical protein|nr:hypothetical protein [Cyanobacteria bacterium GSL.Bin21]
MQLKSIGANIGFGILALTLAVPLAKADSFNFQNQPSELTERQKAEAKELAKSGCEILSDSPVKIIKTISQSDRYITICRDLNPQNNVSDLQAEDHLIMEIYEADPRPDHQVKQEGSVSVYFQKYGVKLVFLYKQSKNPDELGKITTFILNGRTFDSWHPESTPRPELLKEYRQELTQVLNAWENNPREELDMTF